VPGHWWITELAGHFADPEVAAVAPRIVPLAADSSAGRYTAARCNLDLGPHAARVVPYGRVSYLPTAALLVRRKAVDEVAGSDGPFDAAMSIGEDVDLVWRLHEAGWRIRYDPSHQVAHREPGTWRRLLRRRRIYGTSTPMLAVRHPDAMSPLFLYPWPTACVAALAARRPAAALLAVAATGRQIRATLRRAGLTDTELPSTVVANAAAHSVAQTWLGAGRYLIQFAPAVLAVGLFHRRTRLAAAGLALAPPLADWLDRGRPIGPTRFLAGYWADEIAYGIGVVSQSVRERTAVPLRPIVVVRRST
jgi:mycofactocin system glycosyltransferase